MILDQLFKEFSDDSIYKNVTINFTNSNSAHLELAKNSLLHFYPDLKDKIIVSSKNIDDIIKEIKTKYLIFVDANVVFVLPFLAQHEALLKMGHDVLVTKNNFYTVVNVQSVLNKQQTLIPITYYNLKYSMSVIDVPLYRFNTSTYRLVLKYKHLYDMIQKYSPEILKHIESELYDIKKGELYL